MKKAALLRCSVQLGRVIAVPSLNHVMWPICIPDAISLSKKASVPATTSAAQPAPDTSATATTAFRSEVESLNAAREAPLPKIGVSSYTLGRAAIEAIPQGDNASLDKVLLQTPGIYQDSAASGNLHIRNEHANLQYRINGIQLPDGVSGFGQILETSLIGNLQVVTGALPAQYGFRTAGLVDIQTRTPPSTPSGEIGIYGGSHGTVSTNLQGPAMLRWEPCHSPWSTLSWPIQGFLNIPD